MSSAVTDRLQADSLTSSKFAAQLTSLLSLIKSRAVLTSGAAYLGLHRPRASGAPGVNRCNNYDCLSRLMADRGHRSVATSSYPIPSAPPLSFRARFSASDIIESPLKVSASERGANIVSFAET